MIRKLSLNLKFMTSQTGNKISEILFNISRSKGNQSMKFGQLKENNMRNIFLQKSQNEAGRLVLDLFSIFKKALYEVKASGQHLNFQILWYNSIWTFSKNNLYKCSDC